MRMKLLIFASLTFFATAAHGAELPVFDAHIHYSHDAVATGCTGVAFPAVLGSLIALTATFSPAPAQDLPAHRAGDRTGPLPRPLATRGTPLTRAIVSLAIPRRSPPGRRCFSALNSRRTGKQAVQPVTSPNAIFADGRAPRRRAAHPRPQHASPCRICGTTAGTAGMARTTISGPRASCPSCMPTKWHCPQARWPIS